MPPVFIIIGILLAVAISYWYQRKKDKANIRKAIDHMAGRPENSSIEFGNKYYPDHAEVAATIWKILVDNSQIDMSQLEPSDPLVDDLMMSELDSMADTEFIIDLEKKFDIKISDTEAPIILNTFDDVCKCVIAKIEEKNMDNQVSAGNPVPPSS